MNRLITGIGLAVVGAYLIGWAPELVFLAAALLMSVLCYREYSGIVAAHAIPQPGIFGVLAGIVILFWPAQTLIGVSLLAVCAFVAAFRHDDLRGVLPQIAATFFGAFYTFAPWRFSIDLRQISHHLLLFALAINWAGDTAAYYAGRRFGKHKLAPIVSPGKSWEGAAASVAGSVLFGVVYLEYFFKGLSWWQIVILAVAGNIAGQFGDLAESAIKRGAGLKDSGSLLPGHGGMLDRVDSSLFTLPIVYALYLLVTVTEK
ncbi:MAG TPA: phosphatidate cytidylyltransferase [Bryobacteraceae bacterium]|nr:phosphatidate cytidylyltransferase [Bryobacteraceae bacterium]